MGAFRGKTFKSLQRQRTHILLPRSKYVCIYVSCRQTETPNYGIEPPATLHHLHPFELLSKRLKYHPDAPSFVIWPTSLFLSPACISVCSPTLCPYTSVWMCLHETACLGEKKKEAVPLREQQRYLQTMRLLMEGRKIEPEAVNREGRKGCGKECGRSFRTSLKDTGLSLETYLLIMLLILRIDAI